MAGPRLPVHEPRPQRAVHARRGSERSSGARARSGLATPSSSRVAVGVFDSGVGGLSILQAIRRELPSLDVMYLADSRYAPYGDRSAEEIVRRALSCSDFLVHHGASALVIACNTATEIAVDVVRARHPIPVVGIEPAVKPAVAASRSKVVGVLATSQTLASAKYSRLAATFAATARILARACPGLVERVEEGDLDSTETRAAVAEYVEPLVQHGADTLVLGCTHYPFLREAIVAAAGPDVAIVESAVPVAKQLRRRLEAAGITLPEGGGNAEYWTTGAPERVGRVMSRLLGSPVATASVPEPWASSQPSD